MEIPPTWTFPKITRDYYICYRYKRLLFGVNFVSKQYHYEIQTAVAGIEGQENISDEIIVQGKDQKEHDLQLEKAIVRLKERGLTPIAEKCQFSMDKLTFFGMVLSGNGLSCTEEKVKAVKEAREPRTVSETRSFLGLVNYCGRFIPDLATVSEPLRCLTKSIGSCWDFGILRQRCPNPCNCWCQPSWTGSGTHPKAEEWWQKPREDIRRQRKRRWRSYGPAKSSIPMCMVCHLILLQFTSRRKLSTAEGQNPVHALKDGCYECSHTNSRWCMSLDRVTLLTSSQG